MTTGPTSPRRLTRRTARACARPGCAKPATATLRFSPTRREARLVPVEPHTGRAHGDLCDAHAEAVVLPRGWRLDDARAREHRAETTVAADPAADPVTDPALDRLLDARTPLLRRAFGNTRIR